MKKVSLILISVILVSGSFFISSCKKTDSTAPVVTLVGDATVQHVLNQPYVDEGAIATDDGAAITPIIEVNQVEVNMIGTYTVTWSAVDGDGNKGSASRTVQVYNQANSMIGNYDIHVKSDSAGIIREYDYIDKIIVAGDINNQLWQSNFNNYTNYTVNFNKNGANLTVPNQTVGNPPNMKTFSGYGFHDEPTGNFELHTMEIVTTPVSYSIQSVVTYIKK